MKAWRAAVMNNSCSFTPFKYSGKGRVKIKIVRQWLCKGNSKYNYCGVPGTL